MVAESLLSYTVIQALKGENISIRVLQLVFAYGVATVLYNIMPEIELTILLLVMVVTTLLFTYFHSKVEEELNDAFYRLIDEIANVESILNFINSVIFSDRNILDDLLKSVKEGRNIFKKFKEYLLILAPSILLFTLLVLTILLLNSIAPSKFLLDTSAGISLMILSYLLIAIFRIKPIPQTSTPKERKTDFQHLGITVVEKYVYENISKAKHIPASLISLLALLFPMPKIEINPPSIWFGLYLCSGKLGNLIKQLEDEGAASVEGSITEFFNCENLKGVEKWVELQEISSEEALEKIMGKDAANPKRTLTVTIAENSKTLAHIIMKSWKGCKIYRKLKKQKDRYRPVIEDVKGWRIISVFIVGVREYVENLKLRIELATRKALTENILCEEQKTSQNCSE